MAGNKQAERWGGKRCQGPRQRKWDPNLARIVESEPSEDAGEKGEVLWIWRCMNAGLLQIFFVVYYAIFVDIMETNWH